MNYKTSTFIFTLILFTLIQCKKVEIQDSIEVSMELTKATKDSIFVKSNISIKSDAITEHGICWANKTIPFIGLNSFTSKGPLENVTEFSDVIAPGNGTFVIRAYVIINDFAVYSQPKIHTIYGIK